MELFGIGPFELLLIILIALIIFGPKDLEKTGKALGRGLYKLVRSDAWKDLTLASRKLRTLPNDLMRQAGIEEAQKSIQEGIKAVQAPVPPANPDLTVETPPEADNRIAPPRQNDGNN